MRSNTVEKGRSGAFTKTSPFLPLVPCLCIILLLHLRHPLASDERKFDRFDRGILGWPVSIYRCGSGGKSEDAGGVMVKGKELAGMVDAKKRRSERTTTVG